ncbi:hypothetical protein Gogos_015019 [Gossypium gossypioides]|uniref:Uncharacterized protein n=1 Tax=Gossypium gossypioides TaxID=34282 RepID=A0A7J9C0A2_GOSGO|nr:hypothetical protein [Gossypium gossypioides]
MVKQKRTVYPNKEQYYMSSPKPPQVLVVDFVDGKPGYSLKETTATISAAGTAAESSMDDVPH